jgi:hypothetical protein
MPSADVATGRRHRRRRARRSAWSAVIWTAVSALLLILSTAVLIVYDSTRSGDPGPVAAISALRDIGRPGAAAGPTAASRAEPARIVIDAIGVSASIASVGLQADGSLSPPPDPSTVGWHTGSSIPGTPGPAVMVGHVDSVNGPAVFIGLDSLRVGDVIHVEDAAGTVVSFEVSSVSRHPKDAFPTETVYGSTPDAELRLITCGGTFDPASGYRDNVVVAATATDR